MGGHEGRVGSLPLSKTVGLASPVRDREVCDTLADSRMCQVANALADAVSGMESTGCPASDAPAAGTGIQLTLPDLLRVTQAQIVLKETVQNLCVAHRSPGRQL